MLTIALLRLKATDPGRRSERGAGVVEYLGLAALGVAIVALLLTGMTDVTNTLITRIGNMVTGG
jgi:Flp pilus assembly pilin Flp